MSTRAAARAVAALVTLWAPLAASAQADRAPCPDAGAGATAPEQAVCWFDRHEAGVAACGAEGSDACLENAAAWCDGVALDDARVREACFLAPIRLRRFAQAAEIAEYVTDASPAVARCRDALTGMATARVVTNPRSGEVTVDGRAYGPAPIEVQLPSPWWERHITVRFGDTEVPVSAEALAASFDARACGLGDIVVEGPSTGEVAEPVASGGDGTLGVVGWVLLGAGAASGIVAVITGVAAESTYQDLATACPDGPCPGRSGDISSGSALALASTVTTFVGAGLGGVGVVLLIVDAASGTGGGEEQAVRLTPGPTPLGLGIGGRF